MKKKIFLILIGLYFALFFNGFLNLAKYYNTKLFNICLFILDFCSIIVLILILKRNFTKNKKEFSIDYYRTLDFKVIKPIEAGYILKKRNLDYNIVILIILELIEMNILTKKHINNKTYIRLRERITLDEIDMLSFEYRNIIKLIFSGTNDNNEYEITEVINNFKSDIYLKIYLDSILKELKLKIKRKYFYKIIFNPSTELIIYAHCLSAIFLFPLIGLLSTVEITNNIAMMIFLYFLNFLILNLYFFIDIFNEKYLSEISKLKGLYNFIDDFSNIENLDINYINIYDKYYLYALAFGLTNKVEKKYNFNSINDNIKINFKYLFYNEGE